MLNKFELILDMLEKKLSLGSSHIIIKRLKDINPRDILIALVERLQKNQEQAKYSKIFAVTSGYDEVVSEDSKLYFISSRIEDAIEKRNSCSSSSIIVFDQSNNIKSSSFDAFYQITSKVMSLYLLDFYAELQTEASSKNFLEALKASANMYSIESLFEHLSNSIGENNLLDTSLAIQNMWRIGLVPDPDIFNPTLDLANRLIENRRVIVAMGQMCDAFWRRMLTTITKAKLVDPQRYMSGFRNITEFYRTGLKAALKDLDYSTVTDLLWPSKPIFLSKRGTSEENADKCIIEKNLRSVITELAKDRSTKNLELLNVLKRKIILGLENSVERIEMPDIIRKLKLKKHDRSIAEFVKRSCSIESWGGILNTCENTVKDCLSKNIKDFEAFTPTQQCVKLCGSPTTLVDQINEYDMWLNNVGAISICRISHLFQALISHRKKLTQNIELLMHFPILALASDRELAKSIFAYTNTWIELLQAIYRNAEYADKIDISKTQQLVSSLLRLDKVYIKTPHEWKCVLTPLNPLCIEKIRSIAESLEYTKSMFAGEGLITESENSIEVTNCVHIDKMITNSECDSVLLYAGDVDGLCVYESDNRQAYGEDGVDSIKEILQSFIAFAPYARRQLRIRVVNAPSPITILRLLKDHLQKYPDSKLACTFLYTYPQNAFSETFKLEYDMADYEICEAIKQERLTINMGGEVKSIHQISRECNEPSHIALYFDIAQIPSDFYANRSSGTVDNIASLHSNCFGRASAKENKVADIYNKVAEMYAIKNDDLKTDTSTINCDTLSSIATMESRNAIWIATIDRFEQEWTRDDLKVIGKKRFGRRVTTLLTSIDSRIFDRYLSYLRGYLIYPNRNMFTASLGRIISIFPDNILCIPGLDGERGNLTKRVAGATIKALATETYLSLVSDHFLCGIKLQVKKDSFEKVITGIHYNSLENVFTVDVLEFQHSDDNSADVKLLSGEDSASDAEEIIETNDNNVHGNIADYDTLIDTILNIQNLLNGEIDANKGKTAGNIKAQIIDQYLKNLLNSNDNINSKIADVEKIAFNVRGSVIVVNLNSNINSKSINNFTYRGTNMRTITITAGYLKILYSSEKC